MQVKQARIEHIDHEGEETIYRTLLNLNYQDMSDKQQNIHIDLVNKKVKGAKDFSGRILMVE